MSAETLYQPNLSGSVVRTLGSKLSDIVSVRDFGAIGDGSTDDTAAFQAAIAYAQGADAAVFVPLGAYVISGTLELTGGSFTGASIIGQGRVGTTLIANLSGTTPLISCTGGSGSPSNVHICDLSLQPNESNLYGGVGILINSIGSVCVERCNIEQFNYGIWITNNTPGGFSEVNIFRDLWVDYCTNAIRMEQGEGNTSFHATSFSNVSGNADGAATAPQTYLNLVSGYWYNFTLGFHIWTHNNAIAINADSDASGGFGCVQIEAQDGNAAFTGGGRLWWTGSLDVNGTINDETSPTPGGSCIACSNYFQAGGFTNSNMPLGSGSAGSCMPVAASISTVGQVNGANPMLFGLRGDNISSVGIACYSGWAQNGLWVVGSGYDQKLEDCTPGLYLAQDGSTVTSYSDNCDLAVNGQPNTQLMLQSSGMHTGRMGRFASGTVPANTSTPVTAYCGYANSQVVQQLYFHLVGAFYDYRYVFLINHDGYGDNGYLSLVATLREFGGPAPSDFGVDTEGNFVFTANVDEELTYTAQAAGIGTY